MVAERGMLKWPLKTTASELVLGSHLTQQTICLLQLFKLENNGLKKL